MTKNLLNTNNIDMKVKLLLVLSLLFLSTLSLNFVSAEQGEKERVIICQTNVNACGDEEVETVVLSAVEKEGSPFFEDIKITVFENKSGKLLSTLRPTINYGYNPTVTPIDFDGNGVCELLFSAKNDPSSDDSCFYVFGSDAEEFFTLYDFETDVFQLQANYKNYYKVALNLDKDTFLVDISNKDRNYLSKLYNENGKLYKECKLSVSSVKSVVPTYSYETGGYNLIIIRRVFGYDRSDVICRVATTLSLVKGKFTKNKTAIIL